MLPLDDARARYQRETMGDPSSQNGAPSDDNHGSLDNSPTVDVEGNGEPAPPPPPTGNANVPKPKRLACMICRKRKLKCDGNKPSCSTCTRLNHTCAYDEVRRKSGPKRGYVKALEERLSETTAPSQPLSCASGRTACTDLARSKNR